MSSFTMKPFSPPAEHGMDDDMFSHMLNLSTLYIDVLRKRTLFDDFESMGDADIHNTLNCLQIVADTFVEMQNRLGAKPKFTVKAHPNTGEAP